MIFDYIDRKILDELCTDSRGRIKDIAKAAGCTPQTASKRIKQLEALGLRHGIELETHSIGYSTEYFVRVRLSKAPEAELRSILKKCPYVQFAALTKGDFQLFIWAIASSGWVYEREMEAEIRLALDEYITDWHSHGLLLKRGGFIPIAGKALDLVQVPENEKQTLKILSANSRISLEEMSRKLGMSKSAASYRLKRASKYVHRFTSFFPTPQNLFYAVRFFQVCGTPETFVRYAPLVYNLYLHPEQKVGVFNKTIYATVPDGGMDNFFLEAFADKEAFEEHCASLDQLFDVVIRKQSTAVVTKILKGVVPIRAIDLRPDIPYLLSPAE